jgi:predicted ester cyclase
MEPLAGKDLMGMNQNKNLMRSFLEELDKNLAAIDAFLSPSCRTHLPGNPEPTDRAGFKEFAALLYTAFPDLHHQVEDQIAENDQVVSLVTARGTHQGDFQGILPTGKQVIITDIIITRILERKAVELWAQFDALGLLQQLGVYRPQGQVRS